jgi:hypothetical protein
VWADCLDQISFVLKLSLLPLNTRIAKEPANSVVVAKYSRISVVQGEWDQR